MKAQSLDDFTDWFCANFNVSKLLIKKSSRKQEVCFIRHCFCALAYKQGFTLTDIADFLERDHSTVFSSIKRHKQLVGYKKYQQVIGKKFRIIVN